MVILRSMVIAMTWLLVISGYLGDKPSANHTQRQAATMEKRERGVCLLMINLSDGTSEISSHVMSNLRH